MLCVAAINYLLKNQAVMDLAADFDMDRGMVLYKSLVGGINPIHTICISKLLT